MNTESMMPSPRMDERGVALPLALFGLVAVSILVTSALVTSSTEVALSRAHQSGTQALYEADAALEEFVAERAAMVANPDQRLVTGAFQVDVASGDAYEVTVTELFTAAPTELANGDMERRETYSLLAAPQAGVGRGVGALIQVTRAATAVSLRVNSGLTVGTNLTVSGNATISDGSDNLDVCESVADAAITHSAGTTIDEQGNAHEILGGVVEDERNAEELMAYVFEDKTVDDLAQLAQIRFGPMFDQPLFSGSPSQDHSNSSYRWGCPSQLTAGCGAQQASYYPVVAIDANGGTVDITGTHGQGVLLIRNGGVHIRGSFKFAGIIIAEGTLRVSGTPQIEGGVIAMGSEAVIDPGDETTTTGNSLIRFNRCQIEEAQRGMTIQSLDSSPQNVDTPTFAWYEVIRRR